MEQFFVALNTILFLSFKQMFDAVTVLDGRPKYRIQDPIKYL